MRRTLFWNVAAAFLVASGLSAKRFQDIENIRFKPELDAQSSQVCDILNLPDPAIVEEIQAYGPAVTQIIEYIMSGPFKGRTMKELRKFVDKHPVRFSGHQNLEDSIDYMMDRMKAMGHEHVRGEQVEVPHWIRGEEHAEMTQPWHKTLRLLGLGTSVGTPVDGITADVIVVKDFNDLEAKKANVSGKIVVFNQDWVDYSSGYRYRNDGASAASFHGAVAALIRSVAPFSLDTPHTGGQNYWPNASKHIPAACITIEDADLMERLTERGDSVRVTLKMLDYNLPMTTSRNVIGEIPGREKRDEYVGVSGHIDSWDLGQGVMDDAGGVMISVMALTALKELNLVPRRTLQAILWTSEEPGLWGVEGFAKQHRDILTNYSVVFESDSGTFEPVGLDFGGGNQDAGCIVNEVLKLMDHPLLNATVYTKYPTVSSDISVLQELGVPGLSLHNKNDMYFWYHHTEADTITMADSRELDMGTALWAASSYVLASLTDKLPRDPPPSP